MSQRLPTSTQLVAGAFCCAITAMGAAEQAESKRTFNLPRGDAAATLSQFASVSRRQIIFMMDKVRGEQTNAVAGEFSPREALNRMLAGTALVALQDNATGAFVIKRTSSQPPSAPSQSQPKPKSVEETSQPMKRKNLFAVVATWLALIASPGNAQDASADAGNRAQESGIVRGIVHNTATQTNLANAVVTVEGTGISVRTDQVGRFEIARVPTGSRTLRVAYIGLDPVSVAISVAPGINTVPSIGMTSGVYEMDKFVVKGIREGNAAAFATQREAPNLVTVMATDAFGVISDGNLGDFLKRLPGTNATGIDETTSIGLRGLNASHTAVTLDGVRLPSPGGNEQGVQGDSRVFQVDKFPADYIESIEIIKAPIPSMDADAIGGTVNLRTKSAFMARQRHVTYRAGINHTTVTGDNAPYASLSYSDMVGDKLGIVISANYSQQYWDRDESRATYTNNADRPIEHIEMLVEHRYRERTGIGVKLDYRLGDTGALKFGFVFNDYATIRKPNEYTLDVSQASAAQRPTLREPGSNQLRTVMGILDANGNLLRGGQEFTQSNNTTNTQKVYSWQAGGEHRLPSGWTIDYQGTFAPSRGIQERYLFDVFTGFQPTPAGGITTRAIIERQNPLDPFAVLTVTHGGLGDWNFPLSGGNHRTFKRWGDSDERIWSGTFNVKKDFDTKIPFTFQTGTRYRGQRFWSEYYEDGRRARDYDLQRIGGDWNQFKDPSLTRTLFGLPQYDLNNIPTMIWADPKSVYQYTQDHPEGWRTTWSPREVRESIMSNGKVREEVLAGYLQGTVKLGNLTVLGGVRAEETQINATGFVEDPRQAGTQPVASASKEDWVDYYRRTFVEQKNDRKYLNIFPGLHFRYEIPRLPGMLARLSYSGGISRPNYGRLIPRGSVTRFAIDPNDPDAVGAGSIVLNNTGLLPQKAKALDFSLEYYFERVGVISFNAFQKDLEDFFFNVDDFVTADDLATYSLPDEFLGWRFQTQENRGKGRIRGYEIAYNQHLDRVHPWLKGFSAYGSYSRSIANGQLQGIIPHVIKVGLAYERNPVTARLHYNANSRQQTNFNANPQLNRYRESEPDLELNLQYSFSRKFAVFADATNLLNTKIRERQGIPDEPANYRHFRYYDLGRKLSFGIRGSF